MYQNSAPRYSALSVVAVTIIVERLSSQIERRAITGWAMLRERNKRRNAASDAARFEPYRGRYRIAYRLIATGS